MDRKQKLLMFTLFILPNKQEIFLFIVFFKLLIIFIYFKIFIVTLEIYLNLTLNILYIYLFICSFTFPCMFLFLLTKANDFVFELPLFPGLTCLFLLVC